MHVFNKNDSLSRSNNKIQEKKLLSKSCIKSVNHFLYWATIHMEIYMYLDAYGKTTSWQCTMNYTINYTKSCWIYMCWFLKAKQSTWRQADTLTWHLAEFRSFIFLCQLSIYLYMYNICTLLIENFLLNMSTISWWKWYWKCMNSNFTSIVLKLIVQITEALMAQIIQNLTTLLVFKHRT